MWEEITSDLIRSVKEGDEQAFQKLYELTKHKVYRSVVYLAGEQADVSDIVSEIYLQMIRSLDTYREELPFRSWMNGLVILQVRNWNRKRWRRFRIDEKKRQYAMEQHAAPPEQQVVADERRREVLELLERLSYKLRSVVVLRYYEGLTLAEIADTLDIPVGTVKSRHDQAMKKLRSMSGGLKNEMEGTIHVL